MRADQLRKLFLDYFAGRDHKALPSTSFVPKDPTLLFTSAEMVQLKDILWGRINPPFPSATTCRKCFRATDIEKAGKTAFDHPFFEMLGGLLLRRLLPNKSRSHKVVEFLAPFPVSLTRRIPSP